MKSFFFAAIFALGVTGCSVNTGLNKPCNLPKRVADGGVVLITEREVQEALGSSSAATRDFIAKGVVECDDSWCVRDSTFPKGTNLDDPAFGYCSRQCQPGIECPSDDPALDRNSTTQLSCRALLLSKEVLDQIKIGVQEPYLCARGGLPDGGASN